MRRNATREKQFLILLCLGGRAEKCTPTVASDKVLRMEITNKWSGDEPGIRR